MLVGVVFVPAVAAQNVKLTAEDYQIELISTSGTTKEYMVYSDAEKTKPAYFVRSELVVIDSKLVNTAKIYEVDENGRATSNVVFGFDSYWWHDEDNGLHIHLGSTDLNLLKTGQELIIKQLAIFIGGITSLAAKIVVDFVVEAIIDACYGPFVNDDGSLDIYMDELTQTMLQIYIIQPGFQIIFIRLGTSDVLYLI